MSLRYSFSTKVISNISEALYPSGAPEVGAPLFLPIAKETQISDAKPKGCNAVLDGGLMSRSVPEDCRVH